MSGDEVVNVNKIDELMSKVNRLNKNVRTILDTLKAMEEKLEGRKKEENKENKEENKEKEKMDKIFAKKQIGRPVGTWESKRERYADMLNKGKIGQPKESTLDYYKIAKVMDTYVLIARDD